MDRQPNEDELRRIAVHEIGHALVSERIRPGSVSTVTIIPRGGALGYVREVPEADSYLQTRRQLEERIQLLVAGSIAEEILFQSRSTRGQQRFSRGGPAGQKNGKCRHVRVGDCRSRQFTPAAVAQGCSPNFANSRGSRQRRIAGQGGSNMLRK